MKRLTRHALAGAMVAWLAVALIVGSTVAQASATTRVMGNVAPWVRSAKFVRNANLNGTVHVSVYLQLHDQAGVQRSLHDLYTRGSGRYHQFLTPAQFHAAYGASSSTVSAVAAWLKSAGLRVTAMPANHLYVDAVGSVAQVQRTFGVRESMYRYQGHVLRGTLDAPNVPASLASSVTYIGGLDDSNALILPRIQRGTPGPEASPGPGYSTPGPCSTFWGDHSARVSPAAYQYGAHLPWTPCGYDPAQIRAAYGVDATGLTGARVTVGITDAFASPTIVADVNRFSDTYGLPDLVPGQNFTQIVHPGTYKVGESILDPQGWYGEESLDVEWVHALAPRANIIYAGANNNEVPLDHALESLIDSNRADIITNSWGVDGEYLAPGHLFAEEASFEQAAAQGISVLFSSGDNGDVAAQTGIAQGSWPATSPFVTAVGGTSLGVRNAGGSKYEWGWGTYKSLLDGSDNQTGSTVTGDAWDPWPPYFLYGSGGGISLHFAQPGYQAGVVPNDIATTTTTLSGQTITFSSPHRVTPDISLVGDPNTGALYGQTYDVSGDPYIDRGCTPLPGNQEYCLRRIGGTSLSSPLFAGVLALVNQARGDRLGFANPVLYAISPSSPGSHGAIEDVLAPTSPTAVLRNQEDYEPDGTPVLHTSLRTINSTPTDTTGPVIEGADTSLRTTRAWDDVTGLGTPYVPNLVAALS
ncbi:MAG: S53 family peptidase [Actinomycetota bacterium]|nr:S53 family peptidase [Actinomycetota bacterium]